VRINGHITISRPNYGDGRKAISIQIEDNASHAHFLVIEMTLEDFALALTGVGHIPMTAEVRALEVIGKRRITEPRTIECPLDTYKTEELREWLKQNAQEDGWIVNTYLGSQSSVKHHDNGCTLNYSVTRYEEVQP
jgi:hypothetical protein